MLFLPVPHPPTPMVSSDFTQHPSQSSLLLGHLALAGNLEDRSYSPTSSLAMNSKGPIIPFYYLISFINLTSLDCFSPICCFLFLFHPQLGGCLFPAPFPGLVLRYLSFLRPKGPSHKAKSWQNLKKIPGLSTCKALTKESDFFTRNVPGKMVPLSHDGIKREKPQVCDSPLSLPEGRKQSTGSGTPRGCISGTVRSGQQPTCRPKIQTRKFKELHGPNPHQLNQSHRTSWSKGILCGNQRLWE